jgi:hypothetical protein
MTGSKRKATGSASRENASSGPTNTQNQNKRTKRTMQTDASSRESASYESMSSRSTRSQAAKAADREKREERPLNPNNPDDAGGEGDGSVIRTIAAQNSPPQPSANLFLNLEVLSVLALHLEPSELYLCQRVCSHWRDQFSDAFSIRKCLDQHIVETFPLVTRIIH